jgi:hypothetical protein
LLLHRRALADLCARRTVTGPFADLDAAAPARLYAHAFIAADVHAVHDPDTYRNPQAGGQRHFYVDGDAYDDQHTVCHSHPYRYADTDLYRDGDAHCHRDGHRHRDRHCHPYPNTDQYGYQYPHAQPDAYYHIDRHANRDIDRYADADRYAGCGSAAATMMKGPRSDAQARVRTATEEGTVKRKRLSPKLTERQQLIIGIVLVVLVAISLLYCLGFASVAVHQAWKSGPLQQWNEGENYYLEEDLELTPAPVVEPTATMSSSN